MRKRFISSNTQGMLPSRARKIDDFSILITMKHIEIMRKKEKEEKKTVK